MTYDSDDKRMTEDEIVKSFCRRCARAEVIDGVCHWCGTDHHVDVPPPQRQFYELDRTWFAQDGIEAQVYFGWSIPTGGTLGEMAMRWHVQGSSQDPASESVPRLEVFCDAWIILERFRDVVSALAERDSMKTKHNLTKAEFIELLKSLGFVDVTPRRVPSWADSVPPSE